MEERLQDAPPMICVICREAGTTRGFTSVVLQRGEIHLVIGGVPALLCTHCGEGYVSQQVAAQLLRYAETLSQQGRMESAIEYNDFA